MDLKETIERLNEEVRPIADRPIAFGSDFLKEWTPPPNTPEVQEALIQAVDLYLRSDAAAREEIRNIFRSNRAFAWAAALPFPPDSAERFRKHLAHFSILDQYPDYRDALIWLEDLRRSPFYEFARDEIAALSSDATAKLLSGR